jgi:hypothetical protein
MATTPADTLISETQADSSPTSALIAAAAAAGLFTTCAALAHPAQHSDYLSPHAPPNLFSYPSNPDVENIENFTFLPPNSPSPPNDNLFGFGELYQHITDMTPRSPEYNNDDILAYEARQHLPLQRVIFNNMRSRPRTVGTTLGPRDGGVQKRGAKVSPLAAVRDLMPYHQYRARQRRDAGLGESIWDDELEDAFMEGMFVWE